MKYTINGLTFSSKKAIRKYAQGILRSYQNGQRLMPQDTAFMTELLQRHPNAKQKMGVGIALIYVKKTPVYKTLGFYLVRTDGTETDFSYTQCLQPATQRAKFMAACREAILDDILSFKDGAFSECDILHCPFTNEALTRKNVHIDHEPPNTFARIVTDFIQEHAIDIDSVCVGGESEDGAVTSYFLNTELRDTFIQFHNMQAHLRPVSAYANMHLIREQGP